MLPPLTTARRAAAPDEAAAVTSSNRAWSPMMKAVRKTKECAH